MIISRKDLIITTSLSFIAILVWVLIYNLTPSNFISTDSCLYASIARNIARGDGFVSDIFSLNGINIPTIEDGNNVGANVLFLHPLILSFFFLILGVSTKSVIISSGVFFILTVPIIYFLAKEFFGNKAGILSSILYIFTPQILFNFNFSGLTEPFYTFLIVLSFYITYKSFSFKHIILGGIVLALSCMVRYNSFFFIIPFAIYVYLKNDQNKTKCALYFLAGIFTVLLPYFIMNYWIYGSPFIDIITKIHRESSGQIHQLSLIEYIGRTFYGIIINIVNFKYILFGGNYFNPYLSVFFILGMLTTSSRKEIELFKGVFFAVLLIQLVLTFSIFEKPFAIYRQLVPLIPIVLIFTSGFFVSVIERLIEKKGTLNYILVLVISFLIISTLYQHNKSMYNNRVSNYRINFAKLGELIKSSTDKDNIILTDLTREITWYSDRKTGDLPSLPQDLEKGDMSRNYVLIIEVDSNKQKNLREPWQRVIEQKMIDGYKLSFSYEEEKLRALLFKKERV